MLDPGSWKALTALSDVYLELGAAEMAARTLEQARQIKADDPTVHLTLAKIYRSDREYERARDAFRRAFELDRDLPGADTGLAECTMLLGQYEEAADVLKTLISRGVRIASGNGSTQSVARSAADPSTCCRRSTMSCRSRTRTRRASRTRWRLFVPWPCTMPSDTRRPGAS